MPITDVRAIATDELTSSEGKSLLDLGIVRAGTGTHEVTVYLVNTRGQEASIRVVGAATPAHAVAAAEAKAGPGWALRDWDTSGKLNAERETA
jgi:hypothetical protein